MLENFKKVTNPLTIIAIFAALVEILGTISLGIVTPNNEYLIVLFIVLFPILLICLFFYTLNYNNRVLYAPSDYRNEANFNLASNITPEQSPANSIMFNSITRGENREQEYSQ